MKRCPECRRDYYDDTLLYCLDDGNALLDGPATTKSEPPALAGGQFDGEPATAILSGSPVPPLGGSGSEPGAIATGFRGDEGQTAAFINTTDQTAILPRGAEAKPQSSLSSSTEKHSFSARRTAKPLAAVVAAAVLFIGGFFAYKYFSPTKQIESIAVMPFVNESGNADVEYLSDGMTETLIKSLSNLPNLNVKPRSSVFRYKGKDTDLKTIGRELNVEAILNGRVIQRGDQLTLSLELIDVQNDKVLWTESYGRKQSDLVSLQSEIAKDVSSKLKSKLSGAEAAKVTKTSTANPEAYQLYLKGRYQWNKRTSESLKQAVEYFNQAIEKDPNYALAYSGLAETYVLYSFYGIASPKTSMPQAKTAALRALEIDDSLAEAHAALGKYLPFFEFDRAGGEKELRRAIELNSNYATAHHWLGLDLLAGTKRFDEAIPEMKRAEELDPLSPVISADSGLVLVQARRYEEAIAQTKRALSLDPNFFNALYILGYAYDGKGMYADAIVEYRKALDLNNDPYAKGLLVHSLAKSGRRAEAMKLVEELKSESVTLYVPNYCLAMAYTSLGKKEEAFALLEKDIAEHSSFVSLLAVERALDDLRDDPRFKAMLKRLNLPE